MPHRKKKLPGEEPFFGCDRKVPGGHFRCWTATNVPKGVPKKSFHEGLCHIATPAPCCPSPYPKPLTFLDKKLGRRTVLQVSSSKLARFED